MCPYFDTYASKCKLVPESAWPLHYMMSQQSGTFEDWCTGLEWLECGMCRALQERDQK